MKQKILASELSDVTQKRWRELLRGGLKSKLGVLSEDGSCSQKQTVETNLRRNRKPEQNN